MTDWAKKAACRGQDLRLFYPDEYGNHADLVGLGSMENRSERAAQLQADVKEMCSYCPVAAECYAEAVELKDRHAIRGGFTGEERQKLERKRRAKPPAFRKKVISPVVLHEPGEASRAFYRRGCPCGECSLASSAYHASVRQRAKERAS